MHRRELRFTLLLSSCRVAPNKGIADKTEGILALPDACGLRPCDRIHHKNGLVPYLYAGGVYDKYCCVSRFFSPVVGSHSVGRVRNGTDQAGCASALEISSGLKGPSAGFYPLRGFIAWCLRPPLLRGMPTGPKVFLAMSDACGLQPCDGTHLKRHYVTFFRWWDG